MVYGTLALKIIRIEGLASAEDNSLAGSNYQVRVRIGEQEKRTKYAGKGHEKEINQILNFDLEADDHTDVVMEVYAENKNKCMVSYKCQYMELVTGFADKTFTLTGKKNASANLMVNASFNAKGDADKQAKEHAREQASKVTKNAKNATSAAGAFTSAGANKPAASEKELKTEVAHPSRQIAIKDTHRPWFMRASYYYDTTKNVYAYTTSFRVVAKVAQLGENGVNLVLQKVSGKNLGELDQNVMVPVLNNLDNKVDATIAMVFTKLVEGQQYVLKKKDEVVDTASTVTKSSTAKVSSVVGSTLDGVSKVKDSAYQKASHVVEVTVDGVVKAKDYTLDSAVKAKDYTTAQVSHVSSSAYGTTLYMISFLPYIGAKIGA